MDGRPKSNNAACVFTFLRRNVYEATVVLAKTSSKTVEANVKIKAQCV